MDHRPQPSPGRYGIEPVFIRIGPIGGSNKIGGASPLTANATTTFKLGGFGRKMYFLRFSASAGTVPADADGTILARLRKIGAGATTTTLSQDIDLEGLTADLVTYAAPLAAATDSQRLILATETISVDVVNNSAAINTQPVDLYLVAEFARIE